MEGCHSDRRTEGAPARALKGTNSTEAEEGLNAASVFAIEIGYMEGWKLRLVCRFLWLGGSRIRGIWEWSLRVCHKAGGCD